VPIAANDHLKITPTGSADRTAFVRGLEAPNSRGTESSNPFSSSGQSANFRSLSRWRDAPALRLSAGVNIIAFHRRDAGDVQRAIDHRSSRTPGSACRFFGRGERSARTGDHPRKQSAAFEAAWPRRCRRLRGRVLRCSPVGVSCLSSAPGVRTGCQRDVAIPKGR